MNQVLQDRTYPNDKLLQLVQGDLTEESVDAIVNAANAHLQHGAGVAGAIVRRGGPQVQADSSAWVRQHGPVTHEEPAYTRAGNLPCRYVIHAVGPVWGEGEEDAKLAAAVRGSLRLADQLSLASLALPAISTGIYGFPKPRAARIILSTIEAYFAQNPISGLHHVRVVLYDRPTLDVFMQVWDSMPAADQSKMP
jgi:O-acetyl-ADP-ribose deacetylase (regulator of RNase III)